MHAVVSVAWLPITLKTLPAVKKTYSEPINYAILNLLHEAAKYVTLVTDGGTMLTRENRRTCGETCPSATWTTKNPTRTGLSSNSGD